MSDEKHSLDLPFEEKIIGDHTYRVHMLPMGKWLNLEVLFLKMIGTTVAEFLGAIKSIPSILDIPSEAIGSALYRFSQNASAADQEELLTIIGTATMCDGRRLGWAEMRTHWPRHMGDLPGFIVFSMGVQFKDFFSGILKSHPLLERIAPGHDQSPVD